MIKVAKRMGDLTSTLKFWVDDVIIKLLSSTHKFGTAQMCNFSGFMEHWSKGQLNMVLSSG